MADAKVSHESAESACCAQMDDNDYALLGRYFEQQRAQEAQHAEMVGLLRDLARSFGDEYPVRMEAIEALLARIDGAGKGTP